MPPDRPVVRTRGFHKREPEENSAASAPAKPPAELAAPPTVTQEIREASVKDVSSQAPAPVQDESFMRPEPVVQAFEEPPSPEISLTAQSSVPTDVARASSSSPAATDSAASTKRPVSSRTAEPRNYRPDDNPDRVQRRQWWKYNLAVRSGREIPQTKEP